MGIEIAIAAAVGAAVGGTVSKASGGSFWKGAALGAATGGVGVGIDRATGGNVTGRRNREREKKYFKRGDLVGAGKASPRAGTSGYVQSQINKNSAQKARQMLVSGNPQRLVASSGLTGNTSSGSSARRRLSGA